MTKKEKEQKKKWGALFTEEVDALLLKEVKKHFGKWFCGQTGIIIDGKPCIYKSDVERYLEGILKGVPTYFD